MHILQLHRTGVYPPTNGGETRVWKTAEKLSENAVISLATPTDTEYPESNIQSININTRLLSNKFLRINVWNASFIEGDRLYPNIVSERITNALRETDDKFDLVICESPQVFLPARQAASEHDAELLLNKHNSYFKLVNKYLDGTRVPDSIKSRITNNIREFERFCVRKSDIVIFQSSSDLELFSDVAPAKTGVIPNGTNFYDINNGDREKGRDMLGLPASRFVCLFVGSYDYTPNKQAARFIAENLAPELPNVDFLLIGRNPPSFKLDNIHTPGYVDSYADALAAADVALCPLSFGSGTKLKMLDYLSAGLPIITTPVGTQGLRIDDSNSLIRETPEEFKTGIQELQQNEDLRKKLAEYSESLGEEYSWDKLLSEYYNFI